MRSANRPVTETLRMEADDDNNRQLIVVFNAAVLLYQPQPTVIVLY